MTDQDFENLLARPESDTLDFKQESYDFAGANPEEKARKRGKFLKDILWAAPNHNSFHGLLPFWLPQKTRVRLRPAQSSPVILTYFEETSSLPDAVNVSVSPLAGRWPPRLRISWRIAL